MPSIPFSTYDMSEADAHKLFEIYNSLKTVYSTEVDLDFELSYGDFSAFYGNMLNARGTVFRLSNGAKPFYLNFPEIKYKIGGGRYTPGTVLEYQTWGCINLKNDYGHILIKQETFLDKVHDLINPIDINFEDDKVFSSKFLVVADDKLKAQLQLSPNFREYIKQIDLEEFLIEIIGNKLIIGDKKVATAATTLIFAGFLSTIAKAFC
jgi:hypothetical protein